METSNSDKLGAKADRPPLMPSTNWERIHEIVQGGATARVALDELVRRYERAIRYLVQKRGPVRGMTVDDLFQEFVLHLATPTANGKSRLADLDPVQGKFRQWLSRAIQNKVTNVHRETLAQKRGPEPYPIDSLPPDSERAFALAPDLEDDLALAEAYSHCHEAIERLRLTEPEVRFAELRRYLPGSPVPENRAESGANLNLGSNALTKCIGRIRNRFMVELAEVLADRFGSSLADPSLDAAIQEKSERIFELLRSHEWFPAVEPETDRP